MNGEPDNVQPANTQPANVLVLGLGETGLSMAAWLARRGSRVRVADTRERPPGLDQLRAAVPDVDLRLGGADEGLLAGMDLLAISPGVPRELPVVGAALARGIPVRGDVELFAREVQAAVPRPRIVAITGTNGKSTVTALAGAMCREAGWDAEVAGNISPAVLDALMQRERAGKGAAKAWVLELSSFQLESTDTLEADAAAMLNLSEDHLDRHGSMQAYAAAKARVFHGAGVQVLNRDDPASMAMARPGRRVLSFGTGRPRGAGEYGLVPRGGELWLAQGDEALLPASAMKLAGLHNAANALAAMALADSVGVPRGASLAALRAFAGLPHRVQFAGEIGGVRFYDDSKGTNVGSTVAALAGLSGGGARVVLIAGGEGKGQDFSPLRAAVRAAARAVVLIGRDAPLIERALDGSGVPVERAGDMADAVSRAARLAQAGDAVLLSPACASFDMFRNYAHRGEVFTAVVREARDAGRH